MTALVEKASYLGDRLVDAATFAYQRGGGIVIVAADRQPRFSRSLERGQFVNQGVRCIAVPVEPWPSLNPKMSVAMVRDCLLGEAAFS
jgi:hypothetical protein